MDYLTSLLLVLSDMEGVVDLFGMNWRGQGRRQ
jgi:hypothetical protein